MASLNFAGNASSYLRIPKTTNLDLGTGDFTIEWYQYFTGYTVAQYPAPRVFQMGKYQNSTTNSPTSIGIESSSNGTMGIWRNGAITQLATYNNSLILNNWAHFALSRSSGRLKIFLNGTMLNDIADTTNYINNIYDLIIGNQENPLLDSAFKGYMLYFSWVKGVALYTSNFTVSNTYPAITSNTVLFIGGSGFTGTLGNTVINNNVSTVASLPSGFVVSNYMQKLTTKIIMSPLYTNNAQVYYKPGSLASCGVGSVRNSSTKKRRI